MVVEEKNAAGQFNIIQKKKFEGDDEDFFYAPYSNDKPLEK